MFITEISADTSTRLHMKMSNYENTFFFFCYGHIVVKANINFRQTSYCILEDILKIRESTTAVQY